MLADVEEGEDTRQKFNSITRVDGQGDEEGWSLFNWISYLVGSRGQC